MPGLVVTLRLSQCRAKAKKGVQVAAALAGMPFGAAQSISRLTVSVWVRMT